MKTENKPINVLFIDDESAVRDSLYTEAKRRQILIKGVDNLDDGLLEIRNNPRIKFIILDGKAYRHRGQVKGTEGGNFAVKAVQDIPRLGHELNRYLPFCFYTGFADLAGDLSGADHKVINKNEVNASTKLFDYIWQTYYDSEEAKLRNSYNDLFEAVELMKSQEAEEVLIKLLKSNEKLQVADYKSILVNVRSLQELVYKAIYSKNQSVIGDHHFKNDGMVDFTAVKKQLSGNKNKDKDYKPDTQVYQNSTIEHLTTSIYRGCGEYIHADLRRDYYLSQYGLSSLVNGVFEQLMWFRQLYPTI
ncbi:hypothetical protein [Larkinella sp. C7]|uniref:hypothetical protein n=1 Tax=Larkinella sp. C7 TaxID=2576607 RepID=UPI0011111352|nr:hypothetical protein [Larkinella sp. C7]